MSDARQPDSQPEIAMALGAAVLFLIPLLGPLVILAAALLGAWL
jgi:hypothetical protein